MSEENPQFPNYQNSPGIPVASRDQAKPLQKMVSRMFKPKVKVPKKGLQSNQNVRINHKKVKFY